MGIAGQQFDLWALQSDAFQPIPVAWKKNLMLFNKSRNYLVIARFNRLQPLDFQEVATAFWSAGDGWFVLLYVENICCFHPPSNRGHPVQCSPLYHWAIWRLDGNESRKSVSNNKFPVSKRTLIDLIGLLTPRALDSLRANALRLSRALGG